MRYLIVLLLAVIAGLSYVQIGSTQSNQSRYQVVSTPHGVHSVFRVDTTTGAISYCVATNSEINGPASGVRCVSETR